MSTKKLGRVRPQSGKSQRSMGHSVSAPALHSRPARPHSAKFAPKKADQQYSLVTGGAFHPVASRVGFQEDMVQTLYQIKKGFEEKPILNRPNVKAGELLKLKKVFNVLKRQEKNKRAKLTSMKAELKFLLPTEEEQQRLSQHEKRTKDLNMKLVTLTTRLVEAEENKKNYELYILRMKEEDVQLSKQIDHLRNLVTEYDRLLNKMTKMNTRVSSQRNEIDGELHKFQADVMAFSEFADDTLGAYKQVWYDRNENEARPPDKKHFPLAMKRQKLQAKREQQQEAAKAEEAEIEASVVSWSRKVEYYEQRFHKIAAATGLSRPDDVANKFFYNREIRVDLEKSIAESKVTIERLEQEKMKAAENLQMLKHDFLPSKWKDVDVIKDTLDLSVLRSDRDQAELDNTLQNAASVHEGLIHIIQTIEENVGIDLGGDDGESCENPLVGAVEWCSKLNEALDSFLPHIPKASTLSIADLKKDMFGIDPDSTRRRAQPRHDHGESQRHELFNKTFGHM